MTPTLDEIAREAAVVIKTELRQCAFINRATEDLLTDIIRAAILKYHSDKSRHYSSLEHPLFEVGWHKGEMDFGVSCSVESLNYTQMKELRAMITVAIGTMEQMFRQQKEKEAPAAQAIE